VGYRRDGVTAQKAQRTPRKEVRESVRELQRTLYRAAKADPRRRFGILYDKVCRRDVLWEATQRVLANRGAGGVDGQTVKHLRDTGLDRFVEELQQDLMAKRYRPMPVRRVYIPKADGKQRPLGIPTIRDRVVQMAVKLVIEPLFEADFSPCSWGFRPVRGAHGAHEVIRRTIVNGAHFVVDVDLKSYFDTIDREKLMALVGLRVTDKWILRLLRWWMEVGVLEDGEIRSTVTGTPQGGVISPLLANIYLNLLDRLWDKQGFAERTDSWQGVLVRYADDLVILTRTEEAANRYFRWLEKLFERMSLTVNRDKTRIARVSEGFDFLGLTFREGQGRGTGRRFALSYPRQKAMQAVRRKVKETVRRHPLSATIRDVVSEVNRVLDGWANYFAWSNASRHFSKVDLHVIEQLRLFLRRKHQRKHSRGHREWPVRLFYQSLGLKRLTGSLAVRRAR
jgi:group II intron reverse transcriptase/maturase